MQWFNLILIEKRSRPNVLTDGEGRQSLSIINAQPVPGLGKPNVDEYHLENKRSVDKRNGK